MNELLSEATSPSMPYISESTSPSAPVEEEKKPETRMGRPLEYGPEMLELAEEYLDGCEDVEREVVSGISRSGMEVYRSKLDVNLPSKGGLALYLKVARSTLYDWAEKYPDFSDIMDKLGAIQEQRLINKGSSGDYNPTIAKVLLSKHGYREGREVSGLDGSPLIPVDSAVKEKSDKAINAFLHGRTPSDPSAG